MLGNMLNCHACGLNKDTDSVNDKKRLNQD